MTADLFAIADHVAWVDADELGLDRTELYVAALPTGPPLLLRDAAWAIWLAVAETGTLDEIVARTAELTQSDPADVAPAVSAFVDSLVRDGLAVSRPAP